MAKKRKQQEIAGPFKEESKETTTEELDRLEAEYKDICPDEDRVFVTGAEQKKRLRMAAEAKKQLTIRLDTDIVERFKHLSGPDGSYQTLINRALHEWLEAKSISALLEPSIQRLEALTKTP